MNLLAFDTSTSHLWAAVQRGQARWWHEGAGSAQSSATLIPALRRLLAQAQVPLHALDAIVFGRGPGAFTGLRTACAVAQGLAYGTRTGPVAENGQLHPGVPVLPVDTLLAVAEAARLQEPRATRVLAVMDARMGEVYAAEYQWMAPAPPPADHAGASAPPRWRCLRPPMVCPPEKLPVSVAADACGLWLAGNAQAEYGPRLPPAVAALPSLPSLPTAAALLSLAPALLAAGAAVPAEQALPLYIRDKVALTTAERLAQGGVR